MKETKMIRITSRGYVTTSRGRVISPIMTPYRESISRIWSLITSDRATVEEKLPDGTFVKLDAQNFDKNNFVKKENPTPVKPQTQSNPIETFKNVDGEVKEDSSTVTESVDTSNDQRQQNRFNKKNKNKNRNNNNGNKAEETAEPESTKETYHEITAPESVAVTAEPVQ